MQWKHFAWEGIAAARARAHASVAPGRRALVRWRAVVAASRKRALRRTADAGRRRFLAESCALAVWLKATRAARERRERLAIASAHSPERRGFGSSGLSRSARARAAHAFRRWRLTVAARRSLQAAARIARTHDARVRAVSALERWRGTTVVALARRGVEAAVLRAWAAGRRRCGLASWRHYHGSAQRNQELGDRAIVARRHLLALKGFGVLNAAMLEAAGARDVAAEAEAGRVRAALRRWRRKARATCVRAVACTEQVTAWDVSTCCVGIGSTLFGFFQ